jgi:hypothetical protein
VKAHIIDPVCVDEIERRLRGSKSVSVTRDDSLDLIATLRLAWAQLDASRKALEHIAHLPHDTTENVAATAAQNALDRLRKMGSGS